MRRDLQLPEPASLIAEPPYTGPMGPSRVGEWLMVDVQIAKLVPRESQLFKICQELSERKPPACGVIAGTIIIDLLEVGNEERTVILNKANWPKPHLREP